MTAQEPNLPALDVVTTEILRLSDHCGATPVLLTPPYLSLQPPFFISLAAALHEESQRPVRFDWYRPSYGFSERLTDPLARLFVAKLNRALRQAGEAMPEATTKPHDNASRQRAGRGARMEITSSIGRPGGAHRDLVIGYCQQPAELPPWATAIQLTGDAEVTPRPIPA